MNTDSALNLLAGYGIKPTQQRVEIAKVILAEPQHLSAEQVLARVNLNGDLVSKATVYNTLNLFVEKELIKQVLIDPSKVFYDSNTSTHCHFYNEDTGVLTDFDAAGFNLDAMPDLPENTEQTAVDIIVRIKNTR